MREALLVKSFVAKSSRDSGSTGLPRARLSWPQTVWREVSTFSWRPEFVRHREAGWLTFGYIRTSLVKNVKGGFGAIFALILRVFFVGPGCSLTVGLRLPFDGQLFFLQGSRCHNVR
jgi:hypothetical protein